MNSTCNVMNLTACEWGAPSLQVLRDRSNNGAKGGSMGRMDDHTQHSVITRDVCYICVGGEPHQAHSELGLGLTPSTLVFSANTNHPTSAINQSPLIITITLFSSHPVSKHSIHFLAFFVLGATALQPLFCSSAFMMRTHNQYISFRCY